MVKFVSYDGKYPNLCSGTLVLEINGELCDEIELVASGNFSSKTESAHKSNWKIRNIPEKYEKEKKEILKVINENIPKGCCCGCI